MARELSTEEMEDVGGGIFSIAFSMYLAFLATKTVGFAGAAAGAGIAADLENGPNSGTSERVTDGGRRVSSGFGGGSDRRIKQDIVIEDELPHLGVLVYSWEYKTAPGERFYGVMAQDLLARDDLKHAVFTFRDGPFKGFYGVDYAALGLRCLHEDAYEGFASLVIDEKTTVG